MSTKSGEVQEDHQDFPLESIEGETDDDISLTNTDVEIVSDNDENDSFESSNDVSDTDSARDEGYSFCGKNFKKIIICHIPPGNSDNAHSICVAKQAFENAHHKNHGNDESLDYLGLCRALDLNKNI